MEQLIDFLLQLEANNIPFRLGSVRDAIMVVLPSPSRYYEIEFFADSRVEVQTFGPASAVEVIPYDEMRRRVISEIL